MTQERREYGRYLMAALVVLAFVAVVYFLVQQIPHSIRPTLVPTTSVSAP